MPEGPATIFPGGGETRSPPRFQLSSFVQGKIAYRTQPNDRKYEKKSCRSLFHRDIKTTNVSIPARFHEISFLSLHFILRKKKKRKTTVSLFRSNIASEVVERGEGSLVTRSVITVKRFRCTSQEARRQRGRGEEGRIADGFSRNVVDVCRGQSGLEWRPLAGHAVTFDLSILGSERVEKYTLEGQRKPCVCKEIPWKTPRLHGYREPHGKHSGKSNARSSSPRVRPRITILYGISSSYQVAFPLPSLFVFCSLFETSRVSGPTARFQPYTVYLRSLRAYSIDFSG